MCGRYMVDNSVDEMDALLSECKQVRKARKMKPGDAKPGDILPVLAIAEDGAEVRPMIWGFLDWDKKALAYNSRAESVLLKNSLRKLLSGRRAAIPTNGYYQWKVEPYTENKNKYIFREAGEDMLYIAGLYNTFYNRGWPIRDRFTILTTKANTSAKTYHGRMPLIIKKDEIEDWLTCGDPERYLEREPFGVEPELVMADTGEQIFNSL